MVKPLIFAKQDPGILGIKTWLDLSPNNASKYEGKNSEKVNKGGTRKKKNKRKKTKKTKKNQEKSNVNRKK